MCGRYGRRADKQRIAEAMQVNPNNVFEDDLPPSYNVAPETYQPIVRLSRDSGERELALLRWGLVPFWSRDGKSLFSSINARAEGLETRPAYREAFQKRCCLVPADFF
jgi:putative SOS response-associated peptidase YedK